MNFLWVELKFWCSQLQEVKQFLSSWQLITKLRNSRLRLHERNKPQLGRVMKQMKLVDKLVLPMSLWSISVTYFFSSCGLVPLSLLRLPKFPDDAVLYEDWAKTASFCTHAAAQFDDIKYYNSNTALNISLLKTVQWNKNIRLICNRLNANASSPMK